MPNSINEKEIALANSIDIPSFMKSKGIDLKRVGSAYEWESPEGKVSIRGNQWYSQYEMVGGYPINFVMKYFGLRFIEAVESLTGKSYSIVADDYKAKKKEHKEFVIPEKNDKTSRMFFYLRDQRCIDSKIINSFFKEGLLFEDKDYHNAIFIGKDANGNTKHIHKRSTIAGSTFKGNAEASDPDYSFNWRGTSKRLFVFEAPIDMMSYISMHQKGWKDHSYVALCSTAGHAALRMLKDNPNIDAVYLCLDNDEAGAKGCQRLADQIHELGNYSIWRLIPEHKDWNEDIKAIKLKNESLDVDDEFNNSDQNNLIIGGM